MDFVTICGGRLFDDSKIVTTPSGKSIVKFSVCCGRGKDKAPKFYNASYFGDVALKVQPYLVKNKLIDVIGELNDTKDANGRVWTSLTVNRLSFTTTNKSDSQDEATTDRTEQDPLLNDALAMKRKNAELKNSGKEPKYSAFQILEAEKKANEFNETLNDVFVNPNKNDSIDDSDIPW